MRRAGARVGGAGWAGGRAGGRAGGASYCSRCRLPAQVPRHTCRDLSHPSCGAGWACMRVRSATAHPSLERKGPTARSTLHARVLLPPAFPHSTHNCAYLGSVPQLQRQPARCDGVLPGGPCPAQVGLSARGQSEVRDQDRCGRPDRRRRRAARRRVWRAEAWRRAWDTCQPCPAAPCPPAPQASSWAGMPASRSSGRATTSSTATATSARRWARSPRPTPATAAPCSRSRALNATEVRRADPPGALAAAVLAVVRLTAARHQVCRAALRPGVAGL